VVGILLAALYDPIFTSAVRSPLEFALALAAFGLLFFWRAAPLWVVVFAALGGELISGSVLQKLAEQFPHLLSRLS
jgi:chromate transporter